MSFIMRIIICFIPLTLVSCGYFSNPSIMQGRDKHYLSAKSIPPVRILPCMKTNSFHNHYPIPDRTYPDCAKTVNILPPGLN